MNLIVAANPGIDTIGLLYDLSQDASTQAIADAKAFCEKNGIMVVEKNGTTTAEVQMAAEALVAAGVKAVFTPTDNTIMTAELSIYESFIEAGVQHYTGADSFALNGGAWWATAWITSSWARPPPIWSASCCAMARPPQTCPTRPLITASSPSTPRPPRLWAWILPP